ncbi:MAG: catalase [Ruminococcaceae bacterium]|nr:catalase [Oscillospiraceae bacterium]
MNAWKHFLTITRHRWKVRRNCWKVGLYWQGLTHDLSKYSWTEFSAGIKYYQGTRSPNSQERELNGYSLAWMHHKGRNKHHFEYWNDIDLSTKQYEPVPMPKKYFVEMVMDRIAACKIYHGKNYQDGDALDYLQKSLEAKESSSMHPKTKEDLIFVLTMLRDKGEKETFQYLKKHLLS